MPLDSPLHSTPRSLACAPWTPLCALCPGASGCPRRLLCPLDSPPRSSMPGARSVPPDPPCPGARALSPGWTPSALHAQGASPVACHCGAAQGRCSPGLQPAPLQGWNHGCVFINGRNPWALLEYWASGSAYLPGSCPAWRHEVGGPSLPLWLRLALTPACLPCVGSPFASAASCGLVPSRLSCSRREKRLRRFKVQTSAGGQGRVLTAFLIA